MPAQEALQTKVIEYIATDLNDLLRQLDGTSVRMPSQTITLKTTGLPIVRHEPDWRHNFLAVVTDPSVALILMMIGIYGLFFEFTSPGAVVPGVLGGICLLMGLYALQLLPVNYAGLALITLGIAFMVSEAFLPSFGVLGLGGIAAFVIGAVILIDTELPGYGIPIGLIGGMAVLSAALIIGMAGVALRSRQKAVVTGDSTLVGKTARVLETPGIGLWVELGGERWRATSAQALAPGQQVRVISRRDLTLEVAPMPHRALIREDDMLFQLGSLGAAVFLPIALIVLVVASLRILREYERGVVFQLGRFWKVKGPGLVLVIPVVQQMVRVDLRTVVLDVPKQDVISRDNVSVQVNAVLYFA
jgi:membrane-bound serine protease (ClpP class)